MWAAWAGWCLPISWFGGAVLFIVLTFWRGLVLQRLVLPTLGLVFVSALCLLFFVGLINAELLNVGVIMSGLGMLIVGLFLMALLQYRLTQVDLVFIGFIVCLLGFFQALIGFVQVHDTYKVLYQLTGYYPFKFSGRPVGSFQQVNMLASFLSICVVLTFYLLSQTTRHWGGVRKRVFLVLATIAMVYVLLISGSRAGLLALLVGLVWLIAVRWRLILRSSLWMLAWLAAVFVGAALAWLYPGDSSSLNDVNRKLFEVLMGTDIRLFLYSTSFKLFLESPWLGYGLGNFNAAFVSYVALNGAPEVFQALNMSSFSHPHNEPLFWLLQSGVFGILAILGFMVLYIRALWQFSHRRALLLLGLALPLWVQAQLCYPFSLSAMHLFLLIVLLAFGLKGSKKSLFGLVVKSLKQPVLF